METNYTLRQLRPLTRAELREAYDTVYKKAFLPEELKPLTVMEALAAAGVYVTEALVEAGRPSAYASLWMDRPYILIDYLCVPETCRGRGLGGEMLRRLLDAYPPETVFIVESEAPGRGLPADGTARRRLAFYQRCGGTVLGYDTALFGVHYKTVALSRLPTDEREIMRRHAGLYRAQLPAHIYASAVRIPYDGREKLPKFDQWIE